MTSCESCRAAPATKTSPTGRRLCDACFHELALLTAAGGAHNDMFAVEGQHRAEQRAKLEAASGFWSRLRIRLLG